MFVNKGCQDTSGWITVILSTAKVVHLRELINVMPKSCCVWACNAKCTQAKIEIDPMEPVDTEIKTGG